MKFIVIQLNHDGTPIPGTVCGHHEEDDAMADATNRAKAAYGKVFAVYAMTQKAGPPSVETVEVARVRKSGKG